MRIHPTRHDRYGRSHLGNIEVLATEHRAHRTCDQARLWVLAQITLKQQLVGSQHGRTQTPRDGAGKLIVGLADDPHQFLDQFWR